MNLGNPEFFEVSWTPARASYRRLGWKWRFGYFAEPDPPAGHVRALV